MSKTTETVLDIITAAYRLNTVIDEISAPSAEQGQAALVYLNNMLSNLQADLQADLGWYNQTDIQATAPLQDQDVMAVKFLLATHIAVNTGIPISPDLSAASNSAHRALTKRYIKIIDTDLTNLPFAQGGLFGPGRV